MTEIRERAMWGGGGIGYWGRNEDEVCWRLEIRKEKMFMDFLNHF